MSRNFIFLGPPGSGKGTQAKVLAERLGIPHISLGDILRAEVKQNSAIGQRAKEFMNAGKLVPDELTIELTEKRISQPDCRPGFIIDGFPRSTAQADALDKMFKDKKLALEAVIYFHVSEEETVKRLLLRAEIEGRADDNASAIRTRFEVYEKSTRPLIEHYKKMGKLKEIDAARTIEEIGRDLAKL
ncbi:MAG: adenylate kinase [Candidatus Margulisbacteria bacterium]|nr:adenylate kinase [Candidatus Margulisiibacteriota bacterium]